jgi:hypothetical protein
MTMVQADGPVYERNLRLWVRLDIGKYVALRLNLAEVDFN